jgi:fused signal recognition particle receptor
VAGFLFWKKKRGVEVEQTSVEVEQTELEVEQTELLVDNAAETAAVSSNSGSALVETEVEQTELLVDNAPEVAAVSSNSGSAQLEQEQIKLSFDSAPEELTQAEELVAVELPKRSAKKGIRSLFSRVKFNPENLDELEDILIQADFGIDASMAIVDELKARAKKLGASSEQELKDILASVIAENLEREDKALNLSDGKLPYVFLVVGVNGVGKTTTIGKLANWLSEGEWKVFIGAADTFRAAAVEQVATWAERAGASLIRPKTEGQDPASVAFESVEAAIKADADIVIIDTAGRLQNKTDLMIELEKIRRVIEKQAKISEVLLVLDATTGQNGMAQAKAFAEIAKVTGVVLTKLDGTAKGGIVYSIQRELGIPVKLVGVGEGINDFAFFDATEFARGLVS